MNIPWLNNIFTWIENKSKNKYYVIYLTIILVFATLFLATPKYLYYIQNPSKFEMANWNAVMMKSHNLLDPLTSFPAISHAAKKVFRLTVPLVIKIFHLDPFKTYILQFFIGIFLIFLIYKLALKILKDAVSSTFLAAGLVFIYFGRACFEDVISAFDGWAYFFIVCAMLFKNPFIIFSLCSLAAWTDERGLIALPIVILFHQANADKIEKFDFKNFFKFNLSSIGVIAAIIFYFLLRFFLMYHYNLRTPNGEANLPMIMINIPIMGFAVWSFLEGFWLLYILVLGYALFKKNYSFILSVTAQILVLTIVSLCVYDNTRSGSYIVPIIFVIIIYLKNYMDKIDLRYVLFFCMIISFIFPSYYVKGIIDMQRPIYYDFIYFLHNRFF